MFLHFHLALHYQSTSQRPNCSAMPFLSVLSLLNQCLLLFLNSLTHLIFYLAKKKLTLSPLETIELAEKRGNITTADLFISFAYNPTHMCTELQLHLHLYLCLYLFLYPYLYLPCCFCICDVWPCSLLILATFCCGFYSCLAAHKNCMCPSASGARDCTARGQKRERVCRAGNVAQVRKMSSDKQKPLTFNLGQKQKRQRGRWRRRRLPISV